jgi:hypothetical protein
MKFEYRVYRVKVEWEGEWYRLMAMTGRDKETDWVEADELGAKGWDFVSFIPGGKEHIVTPLHLLNLYT